MIFLMNIATIRTSNLIIRITILHEHSIFFNISFGYLLTVFIYLFIYDIISLEIYNMIKRRKIEK